MAMQSSSPSKPCYLVGRPGRPAASSPSGPVFLRVAAMLGLLACAWAPLPATATTVGDPYLGLDAPSVREGDGGTTTLTFTARLTDTIGRAMTSDKTITAHYQILSEGGDTATVGTDYKATSGTLTFAPGERTKRIDVSVVGDTDVEGDETLSVKWTGWENVWLVSYSKAGTIVDDDTVSPPPVVPATVTIADADADEGDTLTFAVSLDNAVDGGFTVVPGFIGGTAIRGVDYTANTAALTFAGKAGETQTITVATTEDEEVEDDKTFTVGLTVSGTTHPVTASGTATGTIRDDDSSNVSATVTIGSAIANEGNAITFSVSLDTSVPGGFTVTPSFTDGNATEGTDYTASTEALSFDGTAGETRLLSVSTHQDAEEEGHEFFTVALSVSGTSHSVTAPDTATGAIRDDDVDYAASAQGAEMTSSGNVTTVKSPTFAFSSLQYECKVPNSVLESTGTLRIACAGNPSLRNPYDAFYGAKAQIWNATPPGTATSGSGPNWDWRIENEKLVFKPYDSRSQNFNIKLNDDALTEGPETIKFRLKWTTLVQGHRFHESIHTVTVTIEEPTLTVSPAHVVEEDGAKTVTVTAGVTGNVSANETLSINVGAGKTPSATEGTDYSNVGSFNITIPKGSNKGTGTFTLTPIDDNHYEKIEWITVSGPEVVSTDISITDGDKPAVTLSATPAQLVEGTGATTVTVGATISPTIAVDRKVRLLVGQTGDSALYVTDYTVSPREFDLTIPANQSSASRTVTMEAKSDSTTEGAERLTIDGVSANTTFTSTQVEILDRPVVKLSVDTTTVAETAAATTVTVTAALEDPKTRGSRTRAAATAVPVTVGEQRRFGHIGHGLRRGVRLHDHHPRGCVERHGDVHADPDERRVRRKHGDDLGRRHPRNVHGGERQRLADRQRPPRGRAAVRKPGERRRGRGCDDGDGDRGHRGDGNAGDGDAGCGGERGGGRRHERRQRHLGHGLRRRGGLHHRDSGRTVERHGDVHADPDGRHARRGKRDDLAGRHRLGVADHARHQRHAGRRRHRPRRPVGKPRERQRGRGSNDRDGDRGSAQQHLYH